MKQFIVCALGVLMLSACKKEKDATPSTMELLTGKTWLLTSATTISVNINSTSGSSQQTTYNDYALMPYCEQDNTYKFNTDNKLEVAEGPTKCFSYDPQTTTVQWNFNSDQTTLLVKPYRRLFGYESNKIVELSASKMHLHRTEIDTLSGVIFKRESDMLFSR